MTRAVGLLALLVALVIGAALWLTSVRHSIQPVAAKPVPAFCSHVAEVNATMASIRDGGSGPAVASQLATEQQELAADATRLATTDRAANAASAAALATEVEQIREAVVLRDPATARGLLGNAAPTLRSVRGC